MTCNCLCPESTILCTQGTSLSITFNFDTDISTFKSADFVIRKNFTQEPVIIKTIEISGNPSITINLTPEDTRLLNDFKNGENQASYIWGFDLVDEEANVRVNVFPLTGDPAPLFIVYRHVAEVQ